MKSPSPLQLAEPLTSSCVSNICSIRCLIPGALSGTRHQEWVLVFYGSSNRGPGGDDGSMGLADAPTGTGL